MVRDRQHRRDMLRCIEDREKQSKQWEKLFNDAQAAHAEQLKLLQEAQNVVWLKVRPSSEADEPDKSNTH